MTGTIFADFAKVATGNDNPAANDALRQYFDKTWHKPEVNKIGCGIPATDPCTALPMAPKMTLAKESITCKNQTALNFCPDGDLN
jgi:hypothetical protein